MKLKDKVAIVTGGSHGIGEAIARRYAAEGAKVAIVYSKDDKKAHAVADEIAASAGAAKTFKADCSKIPEINRLVDEVIESYGTVDILVNNAGAFFPVSVEETTEDIWDEQLDLNLKGVFFLVKALVPEFKRRGGGNVVNISSIAGVGGVPNCAAYCASKGGLENLTKAFAVELGKHDINVNAVAPGNVKTRMNEEFRAHPEYVQRMRDMTPTGRDFLETDEVAGAVVFLASEDAKAIHGITIMVDAGWAAW